MANMTELLGLLMQTSMSPAGGQRMGHALEQLRQGLGSGGGGLLNGLLQAAAQGMASAGAGQRPAGGADGLAALAGALFGGAPHGHPAGQPTGAGGQGGLASLAGALLGGAGQPGAGVGSGGGLPGLVGALLGGPGTGGGRAAGGAGALALIATVAMQAFQAVREAAPAQAPVAQGPWSGSELPAALAGREQPAAAAALQTTAELVLRGMLNAAKADGQVSPEEMQRVVGKIGEAGADPAMQQWVREQLSAPLDVRAFAAEIPDPGVAAEVYTASLLAIDVDTDAERRYLADLAQATGLHPLVVQQIHHQMGLSVPA